MKKLLSLLLVLVMVFSLLPLSALAAEEDVQTETEQSLETEGSVGTLLGNTLDGAGATEEGTSSCSVTGIAVDGTTATVEYQTDRDSELVVAVYEEESMKMLGSGHTVVSPDADTAEIEITIDAMPDYFIVSAYLLDADTLDPLGDAYTSSYYTEALTDLRQKTVADFDEERVLQFDDSEETNFAVFSEDTLMVTQSAVATFALEETDEPNRLTDNGDGTYTITNADESFLNLKAGNGFVYTYADGTLLIVVAKSVSVSGTTVTVTADTDAELADVFDYVKIEATNDGVEPTVDTSTMGEGITYQGYDEDTTVPLDGALIDEKVSKSVEVKFGMDETIAEKDDRSVSLKGNFKAGIKTSLELYITLRYQYVDFSLKLSNTYSVSVSGKVTAWEQPLAKITYPLVEGVVSLELQPKLVLEFSGEISLSTEYSVSYGWVYDSNSASLVNKGKEPQTKTKLEFKGEVFLGVKIEASLVVGNKALKELLDEDITKISISATAGLKLSMTEDLLEDRDDMRHECYVCYDGEIKAVMSLDVGIKIYKIVSQEYKLLSKEIKLCDVYWSWGFSELDAHMEFGFTTCPHKSYKLTVNAADSNGEAVEAAVKIADKSTGETLKFKDGAINSAGSESLTTTAGKAEVFLPNGEYTVTLSYHGETKTKNITVHNKATKTKFEVTAATTGETVTGPTAADGEIVDSGTCGEDVKWALYESGLLYIYGSGAMTSSPWSGYGENIINIVIKDGVTSIGYATFSDCTSLTGITIPDSVTEIEDNAFLYCTSLTSITIPDSVASIGNAVFAGCELLENITIGNGVTSIGDWAFSGCESLKSIIIPDSVTSLGEGEFWGCYALTDVTIGSSVTSIERFMFYDCESLGSITIGDSVTSIDSFVFQDCTSLESITVDENNETYCSTDGVLFNKAKTSLICYPAGKTDTSYSIPDSVTSIGSEAFYKCTALASITIRMGVESIGGEAFYGCASLASITIPDSVTSIYGSAFSNCSLLTDVYYTGTEEQWGDISISSYNTPLTSANIHYNYVPTTTVTLDEAAGPAEETPPKEIIEEVSAETTEEVTTEEAIEETTTEETTTEETTTEETVTEETTTYEAEEIELLAAYTGTTDGSTASFDGLVPNERYVLLVVKDAAAEDVLAAENLLYIVQGVSGETGALNFRYTPREDATDAAAVVYGAAGTPVSEAKITIGVMVGGDIVVTVTADGVTLVEDEDYTFTATEVDGVISVTVTGCGEYIGTVTVTLDHTPGDMDGKDGVTILDVLALLKSVAGITEELPFGDVNNDGKTDILDVLALLKYVAGIDGSVVY